jgi:hypothetical protein
MGVHKLALYILLFSLVSCSGMEVEDFPESSPTTTTTTTTTTITVTTTTTTIDGSIPPPPTNLIARTTDTDEIELVWQNGGGSTRAFQLAYVQGTTPPADCKTGTLKTDIVSLSVTLKGLLDGTSYSYRLCAVNRGTPPDFSSSLSGTAVTAKDGLGTLVWENEGSANGSMYGWDGGAIGDFNGDTHNDFYIAAYGWNSNRGRVYVYSGLDRSVLLDVSGTSANDYLGTSSAGIDFNNDGREDFATCKTGDYTDNGVGEVTVYSGLDQSIIFQQAAESGGDFYCRHMAVFDYDDNGIDDILISATDYSVGADQGKLYIYSGVSGALLYSVAGAAAGDSFSYGPKYVGDFNGDGKDDYSLFSDTSTFKVYSGGDSTVLLTLPISSSAHGRGYSVFDYNNDGTLDFLVGGVYSGVDGAILAPEIPYSSTGYKIIGDYNGDGVVDVAVDGSGGLIRIYSTQTGKLIAKHQYPGVTWNYNVVLGAVEANGDGKIDLLVASFDYPGNPTYTGKIYIYTWDP